MEVDKDSWLLVVEMEVDEVVVEVVPPDEVLVLLLLAVLLPWFPDGTVLEEFSNSSC